jgi:hypothetical protein
MQTAISHHIACRTAAASSARPGRERERETPLDPAPARPGAPRPPAMPAKTGERSTLLINAGEQSTDRHDQIREGGMTIFPGTI